MKKPRCMRDPGPAGVNHLRIQPDAVGVNRTRARVAELADALRSGRSDRKVVEVRVLSRAPISLRDL
jgi:hypothetical protein